MFILILFFALIFISGLLNNSSQSQETARVVIDVELQKSSFIEIFLPIIIYEKENSQFITPVMETLEAKSNSEVDSDFSYKITNKIPGNLTESSLFLQISGNVKNFRLYAYMNRVGGNLFDLRLSSNYYYIKSLNNVSILYHVSASSKNCEVSKLDYSDRFENMNGLFIPISQQNGWALLNNFTFPLVVCTY